MRPVAPEGKLPVQSLGRDRRRLVVGLPDNRAGVWRPMTEMMRAFVIEEPGRREKLERNASTKASRRVGLDSQPRIRPCRHSRRGFFLRR